MEIRQLEYFRAVVEEGTVSGAAKVLKMTQPPVSYQMKMLEEELNVQLFFSWNKENYIDRSWKGVVCKVWQYFKNVRYYKA